MRERVCKNCGGREYKVVGQNMVKCMFCGTLYVDEYASKEEDVLIVGANEIVREMRFDDAVKEFDKILELYPRSFSAYFGKCLAKNKIILFPNSRGVVKRPRFCEKVVSISEDEDFKQALKLAPAETAKTYSDIAKRIDRIKRQYDEHTSKGEYDVIMCAVNFDDCAEVATKVCDTLVQKGKKVYFLQNLPQNEREEDTFRALETSKAFLFFATTKTGYANFKHLYDRYFFLTLLRKKARSSFIVALDKKKVSKDELPRAFSFCKSEIDLNSISFLQDVEVMIENELAKTVDEIAKIETVKIQKVEPQKKEYLDIETVTPVELGHYQVENLNAGDQTKIKWIFLSLKNGDFQTALELTEEELKKDPYNSSLLLARLMAQRQIRTPEDFYANISNFSNKEQIDEILRYANRDFATEFIDNWENLIIKLNEEEYYETYLLYLAGYKTPNRENFIKHAEMMAVDTQNQDLIEKVLKCFDKNDVDKFVEFYFMLAQKSDNAQYFSKILEIDPGHAQSNIAFLLSHFKTTEDKLSYQNREEIENVFKYLDENARTQFVCAVVDLILPVAFFDLEKAQNQLDFYLSYVTSDENLAKLTEKIARSFQEMKFFQVAEKYSTIAISKTKTSALYWLLIQIKAHCRNENDLVTSDVKIMQMPEWETLLEISDDKQDEEYAKIVSKSNLFQGERRPFEPDRLDKVHLKEKLEEFISRNEKLLLSVEKEESANSIRGVGYFKAQLEPFKTYVKDVEIVTEFERYVEICDKIENRLQALDLTLDSSVSAIKIAEKNQNISQRVEVKEKKTLSPEEKLKRRKFLYRFVCIFLEYFPVAFTTLLLIVSLCAPKEVYLYFSQEFLIVSLVYSIVVVMANFLLYVIRKKVSSVRWKRVYCSLMGLGVVNLLLFCLSFYLIPQTLSITSARELQVLMSNAKYANIALAEDIDFEGEEWRPHDFYGEFDGAGHTISNINFSNGGLVDINDGTISNVQIVVTESNTSLSTFGGIAQINHGSIQNCSVSGNITVTSTGDTVFGVIVGRNVGGTISGCQSELTIVIDAENSNVSVGGIAGRASGSDVQISQNFSASNISINSNECASLTVGGVVGYVGNLGGESQISQNVFSGNLTLSGSAQTANVGGLVGEGRKPVSDSFSQGTISASGLTASGYVGGLYGRFINPEFEPITHCYATVQIDFSSLARGTLVGGLGGRIDHCFSTISGDVANVLQYGGFNSSTCDTLTSGFYDRKYGFDTSIWVITDFAYPQLAWQVE